MFVCGYEMKVFCGNVMTISWRSREGYAHWCRSVQWLTKLEWVVVAKVVVELQQEEVVLRWEVVMVPATVLVLVEVVEWLCEGEIPQSNQSGVVVQE